jgi:hypothetical protein
MQCKGVLREKLKVGFISIAEEREPVRVSQGVMTATSFASSASIVKCHFQKFSETDFHVSSLIAAGEVTTLLQSLQNDDIRIGNDLGDSAP